MKTATTQRLSATSIDNALWAVQSYIMGRYGCACATSDMAPLVWYVNTARASVDFLLALQAAKPFVIGRLLHRGGSYAEVIARVKAALGIRTEL